MGHSKLDNYIASFRKRSGLSQQEVALLVGGRCGSEVSRFESTHRMPTLRTAIGLEILFGVSISELFAGTRMRLERQIEARIRRLHSESRLFVPTNGRIRVEHEAKLRWLDAHPATQSQIEP